MNVHVVYNPTHQKSFTLFWFKVEIVYAWGSRCSFQQIRQCESLKQWERVTKIPTFSFSSLITNI